MVLSAMNVAMQWLIIYLKSQKPISMFRLPVLQDPEVALKKKPVGLVYIGLKKGNKIQIIKCLFKSKKRSSIQKATVKKALNLVLRAAK